MEDIIVLTDSLLNKYNHKNVNTFNFDELREYLISKTNLLDKIILNDQVDMEYYHSDKFKKLFYDELSDELEKDFNELLYNLYSELPTESDFNNAIIFYEGLKNNYRHKDKEFFEYYDKFQELFYQRFETVYHELKDDDVKQDYWNKPLEE